VTYALAIFDLDGTLSDSFPWFLANVNAVADHYGFRRCGLEDVERLRGLNSREILGWLGVPLWKLPLIARHMRGLKTRDMARIPLFPGVPDLLRDLRARGIMLALVTSDTEDNARRALGDANVALFDHFGCGAAMFGKAAKFKRMLKRSGVAADQAIAIGDEARDAVAAREAGIAFGAVSWGYASLDALLTHEPDAVFRSLDDIARALPGRGA
jgi:phosphoglycolate phosphatase